jgi:hypothetical protein
MFCFFVFFFVLFFFLFFFFLFGAPPAEPLATTKPVPAAAASSSSIALKPAAVNLSAARRPAKRARRTGSSPRAGSNQPCAGADARCGGGGGGGGGAAAAAAAAATAAATAAASDGGDGGDVASEAAFSEATCSPRPADSDNDAADGAAADDLDGDADAGAADDLDGDASGGVGGSGGGPAPWEFPRDPRIEEQTVFVHRLSTARSRLYEHLKSDDPIPEELRVTGARRQSRVRAATAAATRPEEARLAAEAEAVRRLAAAEAAKLRARQLARSQRKAVRGGIDGGSGGDGPHDSATGVFSGEEYLQADPEVSALAAEGYAEPRRKSVDRVLALMARHPSLRPDERADADRSVFVDIGSGFGKIVAHAQLRNLFVRCYGIEIVPVRLRASELTLGELVAEGICDPSQIQLLGGEASEVLPTIQGASHIYMFDKVFGDRTLTKICAVLERTPFKVLVSTTTEVRLRRLGLASFRCCGAFYINTTGAQNFRLYLYAKGV